MQSLPQAARRQRRSKATSLDHRLVPKVCPGALWTALMMLSTVAFATACASAANATPPPATTSATPAPTSVDTHPNDSEQVVAANPQRDTRLGRPPPLVKGRPQKTRPRSNTRLRLEAKTQDAIKAIKKQDDVRTLRALEQALLLARDVAPISVSKVAVVVGKPTALGVFRPADGGVISKRQLKLYVEVENFKHVPLQTDAGTDALYEVNLDVTGIFFLEDGQELGQKSLGTHRYETRTRTGQTWLGLDVQLGDAVPNGTYQVQIEVTDRATEKKSSRAVTFRIP